MLHKVFVIIFIYQTLSHNTSKNRVLIFYNRKMYVWQFCFSSKTEGMSQFGEISDRFVGVN